MTVRIKISGIWKRIKSNDKKGIIVFFYLIRRKVKTQAYVTSKIKRLREKTARDRERWVFFFKFKILKNKNTKTKTNTNLELTN